MGGKEAGEKKVGGCGLDGRGLDGRGLDGLVERLLGAGATGLGKGEVSEQTLLELCARSRELVLAESVLAEVQAPVVIAGDIHGQFSDLLRLFAAHGIPPKTRWLFLGDYVDRGPCSIEVITLLLALKLQHPSHMCLLRGNHESAAVNKVYGFLDECRRRYSLDLWKVFGDVFNCLPLAGLVEGRILTMHGGISPELMCWEQIRRLERPTEVPDHGVPCDLLWSDPDRDIGCSGFNPNYRGVSVRFAPDVLKEFMARMDLDLIVRAHQVVQDGFEFFAARRLVTLFSAPAYCGEFDNAAGVMLVSPTLRCSFSTYQPRKSRLPTPV